jgi:hypothetical protein
MALLQDDLGRAADLYNESLTLSWDTGLNPIVQSVLEGFACVTGAKRESERAARLWGAAQTLRETKDIPRDTDFLAEADARISAVRSGMREEAWEEAFRKGRAMTLDEAVSYALEEEEAGTSSLCPRLRTPENFPPPTFGEYPRAQRYAPGDREHSCKLCRPR